ncbi:two-component regulator system yien regulator component protein [Spiroplasma sabaudiense Ar-1343]|uniref:Two-component regulator system yien regulator component protein n=1 Tax=Spiroplasma sabaudiense Ar-1343 TaxID=1276257 RepID=W6A9U4_9MOLU|nr:AAA family ATPase [Spiroplasma sabaudiense]AHI53741.1 two-component regulator system yien regulator component protein [Spiroplasma sabaudiense Ar-1343]
MNISLRIKKLIEAISFEVFEKEEIFKLSMLAMLGGESIFLLGKPGIAKSLISRRVKFALREGKNFEYLMSKFSTPEEIYGPINIKELQEGRYVRVIDDYLPAANVGFLDEIWKAGPSIQNTLLTIINEKIFRNGGRDIKVPLNLLISASNELPTPGEGLEALYDRFIIRYIAHGLKSKENFEKLLAGESSLDVEVDPNLQIGNSELSKWQSEARKVVLSRETLDFIHYFRNKLTQSTGGKAYISDRRWKKISGLIKTSAYFNGRSETDLPDLFCIPYCIWDNEAEEQEYRKIFNTAFSEKFGHDFRGQKHQLLNQVDALAVQINQVESQFLRLTIYDSPFKSKTQGTYYRILNPSGNEQSKYLFISARDWNKLAAVPGTSLEVPVFFGSSETRYEGSKISAVQYHKANQIYFIETDKKLFIENDNAGEYNKETLKLNQKMQELENDVKEISSNMYKIYKKYVNMDCIFFDQTYNREIAIAFDVDVDQVNDLQS